MLRLILAGVIALFALNASAQTAAPDPVILAYKEYVAAQQKGDLNAAEATAGRAWIASEAATGDGGRTAVLALNLAMARLANDHDAAAVEPARRATALAEKGAKGVDVVQARLTLGEALLQVNFEEARSLLLATLPPGPSQNRPATESAYVAAKELGLVAAKREDWKTARTAYEIAFDHVEASGLDVDLERAVLLISRGVTISAIGDELGGLEAFRQAVTRVEPLAPERDDDVTTIGEVYYATALAWAGAIRSKMRSEIQRPPEIEDNRRFLPGKPPLCSVRYNVVPPIQYPDAAANSFSVGGVAIKASVDATGKIVKRTVLASIPTKEFGEAVDKSKGQWTVTRRPESPVGCRLESKDLILIVNFVLGF